MGFNKCYVLTKAELETLVEKYGEEHVAKMYRKCDALIGEVDAVEYINELVKRYL